MTHILDGLTEKAGSKEELKTFFDGQKHYKHPKLAKHLEGCYFASYSYDGSHSVAELYVLAARFRSAADFCQKLGDAITEKMEPFE